MADNIVGGLFGMTPELLQQQRNAQLDQEAYKFASVPTDQRQGMLAYKFGAKLGQGLSGMLGMQDPEMTRIKALNEATAGIDFTSPEGLMAGAQKLNKAGFGKEAMQLYQKAQESAVQQSQITKNVRESQPDKVRIAMASADNVAERNTPEWKAAFTEALNTQITPRGANTAVSIQDQQLIASLEDQLSKDPSGKTIDPKLLNQGRYILGKAKQPKGYVDSQTGEVVQTPGANINELAPNLASYLFGGASTQAIGQGTTEGQPQVPSKGPVPYNTTTLATPKSEALKAKERESVQSSVSSLDADLANVDEAIKRTTPWATGWANYALGGMPNTDATALNDIVSSLNASKIFTELGKLKEQSRTGASGLGAVSKPELEALENRLRALNPKSKTFPADLQYVKTKWQELRSKMDLKAQGQVTPASAVTPPKSDEDIISRAMAHPSAKGYTREQIIAGLRKAGKIQ